MENKNDMLDQMFQYPLKGTPEMSNTQLEKNKLPIIKSTY